MNFDISVGMILAENNKDQLLKDVTKNNPSVALNAIKYLLRKEKPVPGYLISIVSEQLDTSLRAFRHFALANQLVPEEIINSIARDSETSLDVLKLLFEHYRSGLNPQMMHPKLYRSISKSSSHSDEAYRCISRYNQIAKKGNFEVAEIPKILIDSIASDPVQSLSLVVFLMNAPWYKQPIDDAFINSILDAEDYPEYAQELVNYIKKFRYKPSANMLQALEKRGYKL